MQEVIMNGGPILWIAMAGTVVLYGAIFREILLRRRTNASTLLSAVGGLLCLGLAGTALGFASAGPVSIDIFPAVVAIAVIPLAFAALAAAPALVFIGLTMAMNDEHP